MKQHLLVIVGPTAVGKTALSIRLAKRFHGEIISCDSMQVYQGMDIGTAKATEEERAEVPHHLIDIIPPDVAFSVQEFQRLARQKIQEVHSRKHLPILVGGTGLYIEAVTYDYRVPPAGQDFEIRNQYQRFAEEHGNEALHQKLEEIDPITAKRLHPNDVKRVIRALEVYHLTKKPFSSFEQAEKRPYYNSMLWIGLTMPREILYQRINERVDRMLEEGFIEEVKKLYKKGYDTHLTSMQAIGYKEILSYLKGEISFTDSVELIKQGTRKYAKRQFSWFKRLRNIHWFDMTKDKVYEEIQQFVAGKFIQDRE